MDRNDLIRYPPISLHLCLQSRQQKALQDALNSMSINQADIESVIRWDGAKKTAREEMYKNDLKQQRMSEVKPDMILTQSISVILFTLNTDPEISQLESSRLKFGGNPWKFHHVTQVNTTRQSTNRIHARQEYYELLPDLPLFSMGTMHFGKQIIRINIFTYNHSSMVTFYSRLFGHSPITVREDFSYFTFHYAKDLTLQLSLKDSSKIMPYPVSQAELVLTLHEVPDFPQMNKISEQLYAVVDPDSNKVHITLQQRPTDISSANQDLADSTKIKGTCDLLLESDHVKLKAVEQDEHCGDHLTTSYAKHRPDVIPKQDNYVRPSREHSSIKVKPAIRYIGSSRRRSGSPANLSQKLVIHAQADTVSTTEEKHHSADELDNNENYTYSRRDSIDIVATF